MNDALPPPSPSPSPTPSRTTLLAVWMVCGFIILATLLVAGAYMLRQELRAMAGMQPQAAPEVTEALAALDAKLERQRRDDAARLTTLQQELAALKEQQTATPIADIQASMVPLEEKLDALASQLAQPPAPPPPTMADMADMPQPPSAVEKADTPVASPHAPPAPALTLLARTIKRGVPYEDALNAVLPQLGEHLAGPIAVLQAHAVEGVPSAQQLRDRQLQETPAAALPAWAESLNTRMPALVRIKPASPPMTAAQETALMEAQETRKGVLDALAVIQAEGE